MPASQSGRTFHISEGFEGQGVNLAHINMLVGPRSGPARQAFATALATPSAGHAPFVVIAQPGIPTKPLTLYVNKASIASEFHGNATWGASQAGIAKGGRRIARRRHVAARSGERLSGGIGELGEPVDRLPRRRFSQ